MYAEGSRKRGRAPRKKPQRTWMAEVRAALNSRRVGIKRAIATTPWAKKEFVVNAEKSQGDGGRA